VSTSDPGWAGDVELDLLLLNAKTSTLNVLDTSVDIGAGLAAIRARHERGTASRPPPARAGPRPQHGPTRHAEPDHRDEADCYAEPDHHDHPHHGTEGLLP
jgi:hypothetical protein